MACFTCAPAAWLTTTARPSGLQQHPAWMRSCLSAPAMYAARAVLCGKSAGQLQSRRAWGRRERPNLPPTREKKALTGRLFSAAGSLAAARTARQRRRSAAATAARRRAARPAPAAAPGCPRRPRARTRPALWPARTRAAAPPGPAYARVVRLCACLLPYITMTAGCFGYTSPRRRCGLQWLHGRALSIGS